MAEPIKATWRDLHDLEAFRRDFDRLMSMERGSDQREQLRARLARHWGPLYQSVFSVRGMRAIEVGNTIVIQDVVDAAINDPDNRYYAHAVPAARTHLDLALGAMERSLRDGGPHLPGSVQPIYEEAAKHPLRTFLLFLAALATIGQFVVAVMDRLKV